MKTISNFKKSDEYREVIHQLIPGGAHTYSKGDDQFPRLSPAAFTHGKGAYLWDVDGNKYLDCAMGLTSVSLGHAYEPVLKRVRAELEKGANFQRPSYMEREMAEKFLSLTPGHDRVKFAKNGSTATTAAVKLARAYTNRKLIAFPGDHPFYSYDDWFIGKTVCSRGVPEEIQALSLTYDSYDLKTLEALFAKFPDQICGVITEPEKPVPYPTGYLKQLRDLCHRNGALLILDEMVTGFKHDFPGTFTHHGVLPDMATWGKGIANGFSFCALTGKKEIMDLGGIQNVGQEKVFLISTTHGAETTSMAACMATIEEFQTKSVIKHNHGMGRKFHEGIQAVATKHKLQDYIQVTPCDWMPMVAFKDRQKNPSNGMKTLVMQEMIGRGVLFHGMFIPCFSHMESDVEYLLQIFDESLEIYGKALEDGYEKHLVGETVKPVFRKYL